MCEAPVLSLEQRRQILKDLNLEPPRLYAMGFAHNNCGGFCCRGGLAQFKLLKENFPERFEWHKEQQKKLVKENPNLDRPFLRKNRDGAVTYITLEEFEKNLNLTKQELREHGGCACFVDEELPQGQE
jgi:hypothetical protein